MTTARLPRSAFAMAALLTLQLNVLAAVPVVAATSVALSGRVFTPEGAPASGVRVSLSRDIGLASTVGGLMGTIFSFGLACVYHDVKLCQSNSYPAVTGPDGAYRIILAGEVGSVTLAEHNKFNFTVSLPPGPSETTGPSVTAAFNISQAQVVIPDVHLWRAAVKVTGDKLHGHVAFTPTNPPVSAYGVTFTGPAGGAIYTTSAGGPSADFDARLLEDAAGNVSATANAAPAGGTGGISLAYHSPASAFIGSAGPPPSRGKACAYQQGVKALVPISPCVLTDGDLGKSFQLPAAGCSPPPGGAPCSPQQPAACFASPLPSKPTQADYDRQRQALADCARQRQGAVLIDMGSPSASIGMVVVRGAAGSLTVDTSADGQSWASAGTITPQGTPSATTLKAGIHARYVRLHSASGVPAPAEVSIWPSLLADPGPLGLGTLFGSGSKAGVLPSPTTPGGLAALLLILLVVASAAYFGLRAAFGSSSRPAPAPQPAAVASQQSYPPPAGSLPTYPQPPPPPPPPEVSRLRFGGSRGRGCRRWLGSQWPRGRQPDEPPDDHDHQ